LTSLENTVSCKSLFDKVDCYDTLRHSKKTFLGAPATLALSLTLRSRDLEITWLTSTDKVDFYDTQRKHSSGPLQLSRTVFDFEIKGLRDYLADFN
jgi:hypothetical protein